jgi:hypothetical protein
MEPTRTESALGGDTLTPYDFAMEEVATASTRLTQALAAQLSARALDRNEPDSVEQAYADARLVYERIVGLYPRVRLDPVQRASLLEALGRLRSRLQECDDDGGKGARRRSA